MNAQNTPPPYFADSQVTIFHGDCQEILCNVPDESVDFVLTDPPYLVGYRSKSFQDLLPMKGDEEDSWVIPSFSEIWRALKPDSLCLSFYGWLRADVFLNAWKHIGFRPVSHIVCVKSHPRLGHFSRGQHEAAYLLAKGHPVRPEVIPGDVFTWEEESFSFHPTQKPVTTIARIILTYTEEDGVILDPFMGGGTTLVAARNVGRRAIGIEIEERHCETAAKRLSQQMLDLCPYETLTRARSVANQPANKCLFEPCAGEIL